MARLRRIGVLATAVVTLVAPVSHRSPAGERGNGAPPVTPATRIVVGSADRGVVSAGLFGANLLWPYDSGGAFDASTNRFFPQFVDLVRHLGITSLRYPGGMTADSFDWLRAIGPLDARQDNEPYGVQGTGLSVGRVVDDPVASAVGPDEFGQLLGDTGASGDVVVNFDTGTAQEAADFVAYMTAPLSPRPSSDPRDPSYWAALRAANGHPAPYDVPYWEVGNEQAVPQEYGWRAGELVSLGPHAPSCPPREVPTCLYAFGGTTAFSDQPVGTFADERPVASYSTGTPAQSFYLDYPPVVPSSETVMVNGVAWTPVASLSRAPAHAKVYTFDPTTGEVRFGDGVHGAIPALGARLTADYESGPHAGFVDFYRQMKAMNPHIHVCETEETDLAFLALMGRRHPYDCVELHPYATPRDLGASLAAYEQQLMTFPSREGDTLSRLQAAIRRLSGRRVPVVVTEYGQLVATVPSSDPRFILSLDEGVLVAAQLRQWILHGVGLAEKYLLTSSPFLAGSGSAPAGSGRGTFGAPRVAPVAPDWIPGLSIASAMIAGPGPRFVTEPSGEALALMAHLAGGERHAVAVRGGTLRPGDSATPALLALAASHGRRLDLVVINTSPDQPVRTSLDVPGLMPGARLSATVLDGPSATAYNTVADPGTVTVHRRRRTIGRERSWTFPAHSVTLLRLGGWS